MALAIVFDSVGVGEWFILLAVVLIVVGPSRLPSTARKIGQYYSKFRRAADSFKRQLMDMDNELERAASEAERSANEAFRVDGDESTAEPAQYDDAPYDPSYEPSPYGEDDPYARMEESAPSAGEAEPASEASAPAETAAASPAPDEPRKDAAT